MLLEVGVDTYITVEEAGEIISLNFLAADVVRVNWENLTEDDKAVCLRQAFRAIEGLPYVGRKTDLSQLTAFPRMPDTEVPTAVLEAQALTAVNFADPKLTAELARYRRMRTAGVSSYRIGKFAEVLKAAESSGYGLVSAEAVNLLRPWLDGSFRIG